MDNKNSGQPFTAAFSQPITTPMGADNTQPMGPVQAAQPMQAGQPAAQAPQPTPAPGMGPMPEAPQNPITGQPMIMQAPVPEALETKAKKNEKLISLIKTIAIITLSLFTVTFIGLFIWMSGQYDEASTDLNKKISDAVEKAVDDNTMKLENEFAEREKYPFKTFAGPADYGELTFEYPKTWSVYVAKDAHAGGDFEAYFNPVQVDEVSDETVNSLRMIIKNDPFDDVIEDYQKDLENEPPTLKLETVTIGKGNDISANRYTGVMPGTELNGIAVIFKIRDKTAILQTDSILFQTDYDVLLSSVRFND